MVQVSSPKEMALALLEQMDGLANEKSLVVFMMLRPLSAGQLDLIVLVVMFVLDE